VTVLFTDLKGSMELLADRDPEEARKLLGPVIERMMEAVHRFEGTVNQVMGDGIMALFGAPLAHDDHAVLPFHELQDLAHDTPDRRHQGGEKANQWPSYEAPIIDGPELIHEQIGRLPRTSGSRDSSAQGLGVVDQVRGEGNDQGGRVAGVEQRLRLDDEDGAGLAWLGSPTAANSALTFMLSARTLRDASASRRARSRACVSRFMRSTARRMYAARESFSATAQRLLASSRSSGSLSEMAPIGMPPERRNRVCTSDIRVPAMVNHEKRDTRGL
jgi:hypothetical protein